MAEHTRGNACRQAGFVAATELTADGRFTDEWDGMATHYVAEYAGKRAAARLIEPAPPSRIGDLPTLGDFRCSYDEIARVAGVKDTSALAEGCIVEISALSVVSARENEEGSAVLQHDSPVPFLLAYLLRVSLEREHLIWIANVEARLVARIGQLVDQSQLCQVGEEREYHNRYAIPIALNTAGLVLWLLNTRNAYFSGVEAYLREGLQGMDAGRVSRPLRDAIERSGIASSEGRGL